jgi:hypothetical protein
MAHAQPSLVHDTLRSRFPAVKRGMAIRRRPDHKKQGTIPKIISVRAKGLMFLPTANLKFHPPGAVADRELWLL